jgi:hypothetical protein
VASLRRIFNSDRKRPLDAFIGRLCVLYEDMRIEVRSIAAHSMPRLDVLDSREQHGGDLMRVGRYRRYYFLRRSIGTVWEFAEALRLLNGCVDFKVIEGDFDLELKADWDTAIAFFRANEGLVKRIRNDLGGHFGCDASFFAIESLARDTVGKLEVMTDASGQPREPRLHFAGEIAASALGRHLCGKDLHAAIKHLIADVLVRAYKHAATCVQILVAVYLWPKFGGH